MSEPRIELHHVHDFALRGGIRCVGREPTGECGAAWAEPMSRVFA
ncbi:MAG: hypothetical protein ACYTFI_07070 [Planctomycetota bacterium]|jgi:hypothetical protein